MCVGPCLLLAHLSSLCSCLCSPSPSNIPVAWMKFASGTIIPPLFNRPFSFGCFTLQLQYSTHLLCTFLDNHLVMFHIFFWMTTCWAPCVVDSLIFSRNALSGMCPVLSWHIWLTLSLDNLSLLISLLNLLSGNEGSRVLNL
jgi:hypothetical protein